MCSDFSLNNFVYFQVNTGVLYFLYYVEDIYIMVLSVLVSTLNLDSYVFTTSINCVLYCTVQIINYVQRYCLCLFLVFVSLHDDLG